MMAHLQFILLISLTVSFAGLSSGSKSPNHANIISLALRTLGEEESEMIASYGCWCGPGGEGPPQDGIDACCMFHDKCYDTVYNYAWGTTTFDSDLKSLVARLTAYVSEYEYILDDNGNMIC